MSDPKLIRSIRYYESIKPNVDGQSLPGNIGFIFAFPKTIHAIGERIARKLQERGLVTGSWNHLYINFTTVLPSGEMALSHRGEGYREHKSIKYLDFGLDPETISGMTNDGRKRFIVESTFDALRLVVKDKQQLSLLDEVKKMVEEAGDSLEIVYRSKETAKYRITISYQIRPHPEYDLALIELYDKINLNSGKRKLTRLHFYEDIHSLVGTITVSKKEILIRPLTSFRASMDLNRYTTPLIIPLEEVLNNEPGYAFDALIEKTS